MSGEEEEDYDKHMFDGNFYGFHKSDNQRSCVFHRCCGELLQANDLVTFKKLVVGGDGSEEMVIAVVKIWDGTETCIVGYLPHYQLHNDTSFIGKHAQVLELYYKSFNTMKRRKIHLNCGVASFRMLHNIQVQE